MKSSEFISHSKQIFFHPSCNNLNKWKVSNGYMHNEVKMTRDWQNFNILIKSGPSWTLNSLGPSSERRLEQALWAGHSYSPPRHVYKLFDGQLIRLNWYWIHQNIHHISYLLVFQGPKDSMYTRKKFQGLIKMMEYHLSYFRICLLKISKCLFNNL